MTEFLRLRHAKFFKNCIKALIPYRYSSLDTSRMTIAFFGISGLDIAGELEMLSTDDVNEIINWIYSMQICPQDTELNLHTCGFRGSTCAGSSEQDSTHIAMTYSALLALIILGDDLSRVNKKGVLHGLKSLQLLDGSFSACHDGSESDMRFVYCASCICYVLSDWSGMDIDLSVDYIRKSLTYEGAFAQGPGQEAHGGTTFCAVASLVLMGKLTTVLTPAELKRLGEWCLFKQDVGFHGRPNKPDDTCYSFWIGATLKLLNMFNLINFKVNREYLMDTQDVIVGGFSKWPDHSPDALHAYFGICGLSLMNEPGLLSMEPAVNISSRAFNHLKELHKKWSSKSDDKETKNNKISEPGSDLILDCKSTRILNSENILDSRLFNHLSIQECPP